MLKKAIIVVLIITALIASIMFGYWYGITKFPQTTEIKQPNYKIKVGE